MSDQKLLNWRSVFEQVVAGLLVAASGAVAALVWGRIQGLPVRQTLWRIWAVAFESVAIPFGLLAPASFVVAVVAIALLRRVSDQAVAPAEPEPDIALIKPVPRARISITPQEQRILSLFSATDSEEIQLVGLRESLQMSSLEFEEALHQLHGRDFVWPDREGMYSGQRLVLLPKGRSWLLSDTARGV